MSHLSESKNSFTTHLTSVLHQDDKFIPFKRGGMIWLRAKVFFYLFICKNYEDFDHMQG